MTEWKMAGKCSILAVFNILIWAVCGLEDGVLQKDFAKRFQGMEDRIQWLTTEHRNLTTVVSKLQHRLHNTHHKMNEIKGQELERGKIISELRDQLRDQSNTISRLQQDNAQLKGVILQLSKAVQEIRGKPIGLASTAAPVAKVTKSTAIPTIPRDCQDVFNKGGMNYPGNYYITVLPTGAKKSFKVSCQMTDKSGWTVLMRRMDGSEDFYKSWDEFKNGFGNLEAEFWLGNDKIHELTSQGNYMLRIEMETWEGRKAYAEYDHFKVDDEKNLYRLHVNGYHGTAGDSMTSYWSDHNNQPFSTYDKDNDNRIYDNCAELYHGAWWFKSCFESHLNGVYYKKGRHNNYFRRNGIQWNAIHLHSSLKYAAMMIRPSKKSASTSQLNDTVD